MDKTGFSEQHLTCIYTSPPPPPRQQCHNSQCGEEHKTATNLATAPNTPRPNSSAGRTEQVKDLNATTELLLLARRQDSASVGPSELQKLLTSSAHKCKKNREKYREIAEKVATDSAANSETQHSDTKEMSIRSQVGKKRQRR
jgi:hypothetical protein